MIRVARDYHIQKPALWLWRIVNRIWWVAKDNARSYKRSMIVKAS
jgi:hypothetical protein